MPSDKMDRVLGDLRDLLKQRVGLMTEVEERLGRRPGYLYKLCSGARALRLEALIEVLDELRVPVVDFIAHALDDALTPERILQRLYTGGKTDAALERIEQATTELLIGEEAPAAPPRAPADAASAGEVLSQGIWEQRRRLRETARYRTVSFARAYLGGLDDLRYSDAEKAASLSEAAAVGLIPRVAASLAERSELQCLALGIFASSRRAMGEPPTAARAVTVGLSLARSYDLSIAAAGLLQRASYLLLDAARLRQALELNKEALFLYAAEGEWQSVGRALVDRGHIEFLQARPDKAESLLRRAMAHLTGAGPAIERNRLQAVQILCEIARQRGDFSVAEACLAKARSHCAKDEKSNDWARLRWLEGRLEKAKGNPARAEELLIEAFEHFERQGHVQLPLLAVDVVGLLIDGDRQAEAAILAARAYEVVAQNAGNELARAALSELASQLASGKATQRALVELRERITRGAKNRPPRRRSAAVRT